MQCQAPIRYSTHTIEQEKTKAPMKKGTSCIERVNRVNQTTNDDNVLVSLITRKTMKEYLTLTIATKIATRLP
jgi:hypothetical protein